MSLAVPSLKTIPSRLAEILQRQGLAHYGWTLLGRPLSFDLFQNWIDQDHHQEMSYLKKTAECQIKTPPSSSKARSAIVLGIPYTLNHPSPKHPWPSKKTLKNKIALYAQGEDYHKQIPKQLQPLLEQLQLEFPEQTFQLFTDSVPLLERDLAYRAGLGWIGKNTCLIHPQKGSLFFIAEILTSLSLPNDTPWSPDFCGNCNRCVESCPTQALTGERKLLPERCISYWTIEAKSIPPQPLRSALGDWLFGCDICQTVCPWNQKHLRDSLHDQKAPTPQEQIQELEWILISSRKGLEREFRTRPLSRAAGWKLQRNAILVATRKGYHELIPAILKFKNDDKLQELAAWAVETLQSISDS